MNIVIEILEIKEIESIKVSSELGTVVFDLSYKDKTLQDIVNEYFNTIRYLEER